MKVRRHEFLDPINDKSVHKVFDSKLFLASSNVKARQDDQSSYLQQCLLLLGFLTHFSISNHFSFTKENSVFGNKIDTLPNDFVFVHEVRTFRLCAPVPKPRLSLLNQRWLYGFITIIEFVWGVFLVHIMWQENYPFKKNHARDEEQRCWIWFSSKTWFLFLAAQGPDERYYVGRYYS